MSKEYTSQSLSQRLHDKGFRGEHTHVWLIRKDGTGEPKILKRDASLARALHGHIESFDIIPAYTFTELWGVLPESLMVDGILYFPFFKKLVNGNRASMSSFNYSPELEWICHESPAEAVGLLLEWLIDNGHMEVKG